MCWKFQVPTSLPQCHWLPCKTVNETTQFTRWIRRVVRSSWKENGMRVLCWIPCSVQLKFDPKYTKFSSRRNLKSVYSKLRRDHILRRLNHSSLFCMCRWVISDSAVPASWFPPTISLNHNMLASNLASKNALDTFRAVSLQICHCSYLVTDMWNRGTHEAPSSPQQLRLSISPHYIVLSVPNLNVCHMGSILQTSGQAPLNAVTSRHQVSRIPGVWMSSGECVCQWNIWLGIVKPPQCRRQLVIRTLCGPGIHAINYELLYQGFEFSVPRVSLKTDLDLSRGLLSSLLSRLKDH